MDRALGQFDLVIWLNCETNFDAIKVAQIGFKICEKAFFFQSKESTKH